MRLDAEGLFWPATHPDSDVAGRLTFDPHSGGTLELIGSFSDAGQIFRGADGPTRILGVAGRRMLTLDGCWRSGSSLEMPGIQRERYHVSRVLAGAHFEPDEPLDFVGATVELQHLAYWIGRSGVVLNTRERDDQEIEQITLTHTPVPPEHVPIDDWELELGFGWGVRGDHITESSIDQSPYLRLRFESPRPLGEIFPLTSALQNAVTLGVNSPSPITKLTLWHEDLVRTAPSGEPRYEPIELMVTMQGADVADSSGAIHSHDMLFTFADLGGLPGLAHWLAAAQRFGPVVGALLAHQYMPRMYSENRLQNASFAAEAFDRIRFENRVEPRKAFKERMSRLVDAVPDEDCEWLKQRLQYSNEPRLLDRLLRLADHAGTPFDALVGDVKSWAKRVRTARNATVHRDGKQAAPDGTSLYLLAQSIYFLVALCLLRECHVDDETIAKVKDHRQFDWLREQLAALDTEVGPES